MPGRLIRPVYQGRAVRLDLERVVLPNGHEIELEIIRHPGGAATVAVDARDRVCLLRQYRHAAGGWLWELPAGKLDAGEAPQRTASRELAEEAGVKADTWSSLGQLVSSPGVFTEVVHLFLARGLSPTSTAPEPGECLEVHWVPRGQAVQRALDGDIEDAKTVIGLLRADASLRGSP
jgi:8-oxo-dGTP pyrophosphatase MutT (NUDIX family)